MTQAALTTAVPASDAVADRPWTVASNDGRTWHVTLTPPELEIGIEASVMDHGRLVLSSYHGTWWADVDDLVPKPPA